MKREFLLPRYWPTWLGLSLLWFSVLLPRSWRYRLGEQLGNLLWWLLARRRHVVQTNLRLCFPELSEDERQDMARRVFRHNAIGILETAMAWWGEPEELDDQITLVGAEHLQQAIEAGKGVLLVGAHYSVLDLGGSLLRRFFRVDGVYRPHNNALMEHVIHRSRRLVMDEQIHHRDLRTIVRRLRKGKVVWYAPDQDHGPGPSVYAPFFGTPAATVSATARLARLSGAAVVGVSFHRLDDQRYEIQCYPALEDFPSGDDVADASAVNTMLEQGIRKNPAQYMWVHRRFKTHPKGKNYLYQR